ncbi:hypothetical protein ACOSP7_028198 [Xanthoceras sorbifolium]
MTVTPAVIKRTKADLVMEELERVEVTYLPSEDSGCKVGSKETCEAVESGAMDGYRAMGTGYKTIVDGRDSEKASIEG